MYKIAKNVMVNEMDDQGIVIIEGLSGEKVYFLNDSCIDILKAIDKGSNTISKIVEYITNIYDIDPLVCEQDVRRILEELCEKSLVECVE